ncbi:MAG: hypothetical protein ACRCXN_04290 [Bacteroidales bacterium]
MANSNLTPEKYIIKRARTLPVHEVLVNDDWETLGYATVIIAREHKSGNITLGVYFLDLYLLGITNTSVFFNITADSYKELKQRFSNINLVPADYVVMHNLILGIEEYANDYGFQPHSEYRISKYILEEDTDEIPLMEFEFGKNGKPFLAVETFAELKKLLPILQKHAGNDFDYIVKESPDKNVSHYDLKNLHNDLSLSNALLYNLFDRENRSGFSNEFLAEVSEFDKETLCEDIHKITLYEVARAKSAMNSGDSLWVSACSAYTLLHVLMLIEYLELRSNVKDMLYILSQDFEFQDYYFGDIESYIYIGNIVMASEKNMNDLAVFMKQDVNNNWAKTAIVIGLNIAYAKHPEKRAVILEWCKYLLNYYIVYSKEDPKRYASEINAVFALLIEIKGVELIDLITEIYEKELVYIELAGEMAELINDINNPEETYLPKEFEKFGYEAKYNHIGIN